MSPKTVVFDIRNSLALSKYNGREQLFCKKTGKWYCGDTVLKGSVPLAPLDDFGKYPNGPNPRIIGETAPEAFYNSLFSYVLAPLRFKNTSWGAAQGRGNLAAAEFRESELVKKVFRTVNLLTGFVKTGRNVFRK